MSEEYCAARPPNPLLLRSHQPLCSWYLQCRYHLYAICILFILQLGVQALWKSSTATACNSSSFSEHPPAHFTWNSHLWKSINCIALNYPKMRSSKLDWGRPNMRAPHLYLTSPQKRGKLYPMTPSYVFLYMIDIVRLFFIKIFGFFGMG